LEELFERWEPEPTRQMHGIGDRGQPGSVRAKQIRVGAVADGKNALLRHRWSLPA
jgi:hypothetical protein